MRVETHPPCPRRPSDALVTFTFTLRRHPSTVVASLPPSERPAQGDPCVYLCAAERVEHGAMGNSVQGMRNPTYVLMLPV